MAAGQGFKTFTTGEVLTAGDVNGYLMQGVLVFASTAARDAAITSPQEGQFAYTKDTNGLWYYDGATWVASGATGDIEGVTAGTGISGGGTSGTVTITNSMATAIDAKGDLVVGTGADTFSKLTAGTNGYLLTADSAEATGLKWAAPSAGGTTVKVQSATASTQVSSTSTTFVDTGQTVSITPTAASSKVLIIADPMILNGSGNITSVRITRNGTAIYSATRVMQNPGSTAAYAVKNSIVYLDSPSTTSSTEYKIQFCRSSGSETSTFSSSSEGISSIVVMEIGA
jgi:hypothetical protein